MVAAVVAGVVVALLITSEAVWAHRVRRACERQRDAYQAIVNAYRACDPHALEEAEARVMQVAREFRVLRRWYPWRRI